MTDAAAAAYIALTLNGTDTLLMAADMAFAGNYPAASATTSSTSAWSMRVRGAHRRRNPSQRRDLIVCPGNGHLLLGGRPGRSLATATCCASRRSPQTASRPPRSDATRERASTLNGQELPVLQLQRSGLGYTVTDHVAQSRAVHTGLAVITGTKTASTPTSPWTAAPTPTRPSLHAVAEVRRPGAGHRPAPVLARYDRLAANAAASL